ncbi:hypothetical protein M422DRAFT_261832 [Sphaerobolus stellatus SS14]|uniref:Uncharacterized protein n=1 Tax=Sphaerobolus stellatus (strain SS14) TaxID=990650 RepID=A0A0C9TZS5_SPHS4|nr:hypothetical protein M422DRAFT_261832 [Sphaerobolus stellatus SS14]
MAVDVQEENLDLIRTQLRNEAADLCKSAEETPLPPLRDINHTIPLKDLSEKRRIFTHWTLEIRYGTQFLPDAYHSQETWSRTSLVRSPSEFIHEDDTPAISPQLQQLSSPVYTGHVTSAELNLMMAGRVPDRPEGYQTCTRTGNRRVHTTETTRGAAVMPLMAAARVDLERPRQRRARRSSPQTGEITQPQMTAVSPINQSLTASPQLLPSPPTSASMDLLAPGDTSPNSSLATTETMSTPPRYRTQVEWGEELGILDAPDGFWIELGRAYVNDIFFWQNKGCCL